MKRLKQVLIGIICSAMLIPIISNNVYAKEVSIASYDSSSSVTWSRTRGDGEGGDYYSASGGVSYDTMNTIDLSKYETLVLTLSGDASKSATIVTSNGKTLCTYNTAGTWYIDVSEYTCYGRLYGSLGCSGSRHTRHGRNLSYSCSTAACSLTGMEWENPKFEGDLTSGNLPLLKYVCK